MRVNECPFCRSAVRIKKVECTNCGIGVEGDFYTSPLLALTQDQQLFVELFVLSGGSLKEMAQTLGITYPTVRSRLDAVIEALKKQVAGKQEYKDEILQKVEKGELSPEKAALILKSL